MALSPKPLRELFKWTAGALFVCLGSFSHAQAYKDAIGYNQLLTEVGPGLANGFGVTVAIVEGDTNDGPSNQYYPNTAIADFSGKTFTDQSNLINRTTSGHATDVAQRFFGSTFSIAGGVTNIQVYDADDFISNKQGLETAILPAATSFQVVNHSYVSQPSLGSPVADSQANARLDFTINRDNFTSVVAANNGVTTNDLPVIYTQSYNSISVGLSSGNHSAGFTDLNGAGRVKPDIVAPEAFTSYSTPLVSSAAAMLHQAAADFGSTNAQNSEVMKSIIMAGATKDEFPLWNNAQNASNVTVQPLDTRFGAGELNIFNSYKILEAGESNASAIEPLGLSGLRGWDYGNLTGPGNDLYWNFEIGAGQTASEASILLTWNAQYSDFLGANPGTLSLANLDLRLFDSSSTFLGSQVAASLSTVDNVEHLYLKDLSEGLYTIALSGNMASDFGLAWNITAVPEPSSYLLVALIGGGIWLRRKRFQA